MFMTSFSVSFIFLKIFIKKCPETVKNGKKPSPGRIALIFELSLCGKILIRFHVLYIKIGRGVYEIKWRQTDRQKFYCIFYLFGLRLMDRPYSGIEIPTITNVAVVL